MDITDFVASHRAVLLIGDYSAYRAQLSRQLHALRRRLGRATPKREKFAQKAVTAEDIGGNHEFAHLLLLTSERAWAHAMLMKSAHGDDAAGPGITGSTRRHIISRLEKAAKTASELVERLRERHVSRAGDGDVLEARAYRASLAGAEAFEKQSEGRRNADDRASEQAWQACLRHYAEARVIYAAFYERHTKDVYRDILANTVDPTIRYAAYQAHLSRTIAIPTIAKRYFPTDDAELVALVEQVDEYALKDKPAPSTDADDAAAAAARPQDIPNSVTWRGRTANIVDASIGQALAAVTAAEARLRSYLASGASASNRDKAAAYDDVLTASQDVADATKRATDELEKERVDEGDPRMQDLRVTSLAVNYDLVSWRVGRNRVLIGHDDGLAFAAQQPKQPRRARKDGPPYREKEEPRSRKLARLRERNVLYDATIQSIDSIKELRGAMRDSTFVAELDGQAAYFRALKCLNISRSHSLLAQPLHALALLQRASSLLTTSPPPTRTADAAAAAASSPPTLALTPASVSAAQHHIAALLRRTHALVELRALESHSRLAAEKNPTAAAPTIDTLHAHPPPGLHVDLRNLVQYPPRLRPVPLKPLFLDVAWNYIEYPGRRREREREEEEEEEEEEKEKVAAAAGPGEVQMADGVAGEGERASPPPPAKKRGWFGFGR